MTVDYRVGDVRDRLAEIPDGSVDLVTCSPPFLALRSYLPEGHESKHAEIGSEATPAEFMSTLLGLAREWRRILAPHGSIAIELGDTYSGSGGGGGDYLEGGWREGQQQFAGSGATMRESNAAHWRQKAARKADWPLPKSLTGIPTLFAWSLAYGRNLLDPADTLDPWRVRNVIVWARPNPAVGALGDKYRPATSYITVACPSDKRWFDLDAVRTEAATGLRVMRQTTPTFDPTRSAGQRSQMDRLQANNPAGAPPLDHWTDDPTDPDDGDLTWKLSTEGSSLAHYAMWPSTLAARLVDSMCPREVCRECGTPRRRITSTEQVDTGRKTNGSKIRPAETMSTLAGTNYAKRTEARTSTLGWSDCGHGRVECANCKETIPHAVRRPGEASRVPARVVRYESNEQEPQVPGAVLPAVRGDVLRPQDPEDVLASVRREAGSAGRPAELVSEEERQLCEQPRLRNAVSAGSPDGDRLGQEVGSGTSLRDVTSDGSSLDEQGTGASSERSQVGQSTGEPRTGDEGSAPRGSRVPPLPQRIQPQLGTCPQCASSAFVYVADNYRPGIVLDPFAGTGTTLAVADFLGRDAIGIDLDPRNAELYPLRRAEVERKLNPTVVAQVPGQLGLLDGVA